MLPHMMQAQRNSGTMNTLYKRKLGSMLLLHILHVCRLVPSSDTMCNHTFRFWIHVHGLQMDSLEQKLPIVAVSKFANHDHCGEIEEFKHIFLNIFMSLDCFM